MLPYKEVKITEYVDVRGRVPYRDWVVKRDANTSARVITSVLRLRNGNFTTVKPVGSGLSEIRLDFGPGY